MSRRAIAAAVLALLLGALAASVVDPDAPPFSGRERLYAVSLLDGQTYFGHLEDVFWSDELVLRDAYYLQDASGITELSVALAQRGGEVHAPADGMRVRREKVLLVEHVGPGSPVARAIAAQRAIAEALR